MRQAEKPAQVLSAGANKFGNFSNDGSPNMPGVSMTEQSLISICTLVNTGRLQPAGH